MPKHSFWWFLKSEGMLFSLVEEVLDISLELVIGHRTCQTNFLANGNWEGTSRE